jgi:nitrogen fixation/metabolism regulation signal transduction histidine kinase
LRVALKNSFTLVLSLVLLVAILASVYGAFFSARRLIEPMQQLMQATRAVARGDFETKLPRPTSDEIGFLINSFNEMTQRLAVARQETRDSQQEVERERHKLEVILARLSTGVLSLEADLRIRTANHAASAILGVDLETQVGTPLATLARDRSLLSQLLAVCTQHIERGHREWREQIMLRGEVGRRVLMCACSELPSEDGQPHGYVIVFDEITTLVQAQRDAAWGEVARRLAHEIKNPLTPIQLSAERLRHRYLGGDGRDLGLLDRATHTIIQQVEAMKDMVNAFSQYARAPDVELTRFDLNELITQVTELYRHQEKPVKIVLQLDPHVPLVEADVGRIRQVLHNLIRNALEAMEEQSNAEIDISTRLATGTGASAVAIEVADNGPGFAESVMEQAFDPYVTSKAKGTGLGLAIVKKLVEEHGGQVRAANMEQGGARISILLPISGGSEALPHGQPDHRRERA